MKEIILVKNGELVLKGLNRSSFEDVLIKNMRRHLEDLGEFKFTKSQSTVMVEAPNDETDLDDAAERLEKVFGIAALSRAAVCEKNMQSIIKTAREYLEDELSLANTFKVEAKRSDKKFPLKSPEICRELGGALLKTFGNLKVDVIIMRLCAETTLRAPAVCQRAQAAGAPFLSAAALIRPLRPI